MSVVTWFGRGGPIMPLLLGVGLALYGLLVHRLLAPQGAPHAVLIRALIVVAPLLGLLGTVSGIVESFEAMMIRGDARAMSDGIAQALTTTQYGLALAAPALMLERWSARRALVRAGPEGGQ